MKKQFLTIITIFIIISVVLLMFFNINKKPKNSILNLEDEITLKADRLGFMWTDIVPNDDLNFKWIRTNTAPFRRDYLEPKKGFYDFSITDEFVRRAQEKNIHVLATIYPYPRWEQPDKDRYEKENFSLDNLSLWAPPEYKGPPKDLSSYKRFVKALVERYDGDGIDDMPGLKIPIKYWEIINEVESGYINSRKGKINQWFFNGTPEEYVQILKTSYEAIKESDKDAFVLNAGMSPIPTNDVSKLYHEFWGKVFEKGEDFMDIISVHSLKDDKVENFFQNLNRFYGKYVKNKPIWITEFSTKSIDDCLTGIITALNHANKIFLVSYFKMEGLPEDALTTALRDYDGNPTELYFPIKTLGLLLGNAQKIEKINNNAYKFYRDDSIIFALWKQSKLPEGINGKFIKISYNGSYEIIDSKDYEESTKVQYLVVTKDLEGFLKKFKNQLKNREDIEKMLPSKYYVGKKDRKEKKINKKAIPFFGIEEDFIQENDYASLSTEDIKNLGVGIVRTHGGPFVWENIEPKRGTFDFSLTDNVVKQAAKAGVTLLASLWPYAMWDQGNDESCRVGGKIDAMRGRIPDFRCMPKDMEEYRRFVKEMVERYDGDDDFGNQLISEEMKAIIKKNPVLFWEIDNEVDTGDNVEHAKFFVGSIKDYVVLLKNSYNAIKEVCAECNVVIAAPAGNIKSYYDQISSYRGDEYFDVYNIHVPVDDAQREISALKGKPIIYTEGVECGTLSLLKGILTSALLNVDSTIFCMTLEKAKVDSKGGLDKFDSSKIGKYFLLYQDGSKTPAYHAAQNIVHELTGFTKVQQLMSGDINSFKVFFQNKNPVYVYYLGEGATSREYSPGFSDFVVKDLFGNEKRSNNMIMLEEGNAYFIEAKDKYNEMQKHSKQKDETKTTEKFAVTDKKICGDNYCTIEEANSNSCPQDCSGRSCGDGICDEVETKELCPQDCAV